jgi:UDP-N-acetylmuramyl tripeptide synthase
MSKPLITILGKTIRRIARVRGGGSALPGLIVERIDPLFMKTTLSQLPFGVVVISGTNGKTTTTKIVVELLEAQGLRVFTNKTGSNFTRGVVAALLGEINLKGELKADIAVLELDEAHAVHFVDTIAPKYSLILNVMRDQLDRFGEIDYTAKLLRHIAQATTCKVIFNREDPRILNIAKSLDSHKVAFFGLDKTLLPLFPSDDNLHQSTYHSVGNSTADVELLSINKKAATYRIGKHKFKTNLNLNGVYNAFNAAAALTLVRTIMGSGIDSEKLVNDLSKIKPAFGRGESIIVNGQPVELILVKNPSGFRLGLKSFDPSKYSTMIAVNDEYADGRDMSWLWDIDYSSLAEHGVDQISGIRGYDMALRLQYDDVKVMHVDTNIKHALKHFLAISPDKPKRIYCTYTAMLAIRRELTKNTKFEVTR